MATKIELINKLRSPEKKVALQALEDLRARGWLSDGSLRGITLCKADLHDVDFMEADLTNADFHSANLECVDFSKSQLRASKFTRANLFGANFDKANLTNVDFYKANLRGARNLTAEQLLRVKVLYGAIMPDGSTYNGQFNLAGDLGLAKWAKVNLDDSLEMANFYGVSIEAYLEGQKQKSKMSITK